MYVCESEWSVVQMARSSLLRLVPVDGAAPDTAGYTWRRDAVDEIDSAVGNGSLPVHPQRDALTHCRGTQNVEPKQEYHFTHM